MVNFVAHRWWFLGVSIAITLAALVILALPPRLVPGIEFSSGSSFTLRFEQAPDISDLRDAMSGLDHPEARIQETGPSEFLFRTDELEGAPALDDATPGPVPGGELEQIENTLRGDFGNFERVDFSTVSGSVSSEIGWYSFLAVCASALAILFYLVLAFRKVGGHRAFKYATCCIIALIHDAVIVLAFYSLMGKLFGTEVDTAFITAMLTIIGFSVHDTIVVFDRLRETVSEDPYIPFEEAVNAALTETLPRSLCTSLTLIITTVALLLIGGETIRDFLLVLLVGSVAGAYSSIAIAAQSLVAWENGDIPRFFRRLTGRDNGDVSASAEPAR